MPVNPQPYPIIDGFLFKQSLRCDLRFLSLAVNEFDALRRAGSFRPKMWSIPNDPNGVQIPARDSYEFQLYVTPGAAIWGYQFIGNAGQDSPQEDPQGTLAWNVRDGCDDLPLWSEPPTRRKVTGPVPQVLLAKLMIVGAPGLLNVEIASTFPTVQTAQLILYGGEPVYEYS